MKKIAILNGPNLDRLGLREPEIYGRATLADLETALGHEFASAAKLEFFQSNHEGALLDKIAALADAKADGLVINPGAFTHTSVALRDALLGSKLPAVEVHISNIYQREEFRHRSLTAPACLAVISGLGLEGYHAAVRFLLKRK
jgi:3-dehydroquinate dehydratase-2